MIKTRHIISVILPAILVACLAIFVRFIQYAPQSPDNDKLVGAQQDNQGIQIPIYPDDPILGNKKAATTLVAFEDFGCGGCRAQSVILQNLINKHPNKIKVIWKGLLVTKLPHPTDLAHKYGFCANKQGKFSQFLELAFANGNNLTQDVLDFIVDKIDLSKKKLSDCLESGDAADFIAKNEQLGMALNIQSVPTFFLNNKQITPPQILEGWEAVLGL